MTLGLAPREVQGLADCLGPLLSSFLGEVYVHSAQKAAPYLHFNIDLATSSVVIWKKDLQHQTSV